jgi:hypothetical protein
MAVLNNEAIRETYNYVATIENIVKKEVRQVSGNKSYIDKIVPEHLKRVYSLKEKMASEFSDSLSRTSYESSVISLVASFEKVVFSKYKTSYGTIKGIVKDSSNERFDYFKSRERFVDGTIDKLHAIIELIEGHINNDLMEKLKIIKEHRDYIAHGKRFGKEPDTGFSLIQVAEILDGVISEIE